MNERMAKEIRQLLEERADKHAEHMAQSEHEYLQRKAQLKNYNTQIYTSLMTYLRQNFKYHIARND